MGKKYAEHLYWIKYSVITLTFGVWIGLIGYSNLSSTPFSKIIHMQEARIKKPLYETDTQKGMLSVVVAKIDARSN